MHAELKQEQMFMLLQDADQYEVQRSMGLGKTLKLFKLMHMLHITDHLRCAAVLRC